MESLCLNENGNILYGRQTSLYFLLLHLWEPNIVLKRSRFWSSRSDPTGSQSSSFPSEKKSLFRSLYRQSFEDELLNDLGLLTELHFRWCAVTKPPFVAGKMPHVYRWCARTRHPRAKSPLPTLPHPRVSCQTRIKVEGYAGGGLPALSYRNTLEQVRWIALWWLLHFLITAILD